MSEPTRLSDLLDLTRTMLERAEAGDWSGVAKMSRRRQRGLEALLNEGVPPDRVHQTRDLLERMQALDHTIRERGELALGGVKRELAAIDNARRVHKAYTDHRP